MERIVYTRAKLLNVRSVIGPSPPVPPINDRLDDDTLRILFGQGRPSSPSVRRPPNWGNWRADYKGSGGKHITSGAKAAPRVITRPTHVLDKPLRKTENPFVPSKKRRQINEIEQAFKRQLRMLLNKCSGNNFHTIRADFIEMVVSAPENVIGYFGNQLFDKVVFDKGLMINEYASLCTALRTDQLDSFAKGFIARAVEVLPHLKETKQVVATVTFVAKVVLEKVLPLSYLEEIIKLVRTEELTLSAKTTLLKKSEDIAKISTELYDSWAYQISWFLNEKKLIKRLQFACQDAIREARKIRGKSFAVFTITDTCEMWFGR